MKPTELLEAIGTANPKVLDGIRKERALALIRATLAYLARTLDASKEGAVVVAGLGRFRVRIVEREVEGKKVMQKKVMYMPVQPKDRDGSAKAKRVDESDS